MTKNSDLHSHSYYSDGTCSPKALVRLAKRRGVKNLALTDHNSVGGVREAVIEGKKIGVNVIPAVEVRFDKGELLGYFVDITNKELLSKLKEKERAKSSLVRKWCKTLEKGGYPVSMKEIRKVFPHLGDNLSGFHVIYCLHRKGYGPLFEIGGMLKAEGFVTARSKNFTMLQAIKLIKNAGGVPVLAHPWLSSKDVFKKIGRYVEAGLKGIEINNGDPLSFMRRTGGKDIVKKIKAAAKRYDLIITRGSDYHGDDIVKLMLGDHGLGRNNCDEKVVERLGEVASKS